MKFNFFYKWVLSLWSYSHLEWLHNHVHTCNSYIITFTLRPMTHVTLIVKKTHCFQKKKKTQNYNLFLQLFFNQATLVTKILVIA